MRQKGGYGRPAKAPLPCRPLSRTTGLWMSLMIRYDPVCCLGMAIVQVSNSV